MKLRIAILLRQTILSSVLLVTCVGAGFGADLPSRKETPVLGAEPQFSWTGLYIGLQGGGDFGRQTGIWGDAKRAGLSPYANNPEGGLIGGYIGYNYQIGRIVFGVEADANEALGVNSSVTTVYNSLGLNGNPVGTTLYRIGGHDIDDENIRLRFGYAVDRALLYAAGGVAFGYVNTSYGLATAAPYLSMTTHRTGWTIGGGLEYAFNNSISGRIEYRYIDFGTKSFTHESASAGDYDNVGFNSSAVLVGLTFKFGAPGPAVAAY